MKDFKNWLDGTLFINHEFKEKTQYLSSSLRDEDNQAAALHEETFNIDPQEEQGSSSVDEKPINKINWGERKMEDNDKAVDLWLRTNIPKAEKKSEDTNEDSNLEETTRCSICEMDMPKINQDINTCQMCLQWIKESTNLINKNEEDDTFAKENATRSQRDDEIEFSRIPIAGENESDYEDSDEYEEEEDSTFPYLDGEDNEDTNSNDTEDADFQSIPVVIALSGPTTEEQEQEDGQIEDSDTDNESLGTTISTMFNDETVEQQSISNATNPPIFTTPEKRDTTSILELLRRATQKRTQLFTFDAREAFLNEPTPSVSLAKSDDIAFLVGPRRDGIIRSHQLSPIPLHDNTYQPLYITDAEPLLTFHTNDTTFEQGTYVNKNENDKNLKKTKRKKKTTDAIKLNRRNNLDFDFTDEGYPLALFQFGGEQMKNDYETNKRARSTSPTSSTDSKASIEIYYKALRTYPPEIDESNAESAERTKLIDQKVYQMKQDRIKRKKHKQQRDTNEKQKEVYTNNLQTYDFPEALPENNPSITTHQIDVIFDTGATFSMLPGQFEFA